MNIAYRKERPKLLRIVTQWALLGAFDIRVSKQDQDIRLSLPDVHRILKSLLFERVYFEAVNLVVDGEQTEILGDKCAQVKELDDL